MWRHTTWIFLWVLYTWLIIHKKLWVKLLRQCGIFFFYFIMEHCSWKSVDWGNAYVYDPGKFEYWSTSLSNSFLQKSKHPLSPNAPHSQFTKIYNINCHMIIRWYECLMTLSTLVQLCENQTNKTEKTRYLSQNVVESTPHQERDSK